MTLLPLLLAGAPALFGPISLDIPVNTTGNPFDPRENDVRVVLRGPRGTTAERLAYFANGKWHVRGYLPVPGTYTGTVMVNGKSAGALKDIKVANKPVLSMIQTDGIWFKEANGKPYWPIGINTAWGSKEKPVTWYFPKMKAAGMNWARVWGAHWDDRNPYWTTNVAKPKDNWMSEDALDRWEQVVTAAEKNGIRFQFVLFHHGMFSSYVNPNWQDHPWNAKNGGFLKSARDFFTDDEAKRRTKMLLRYYVARFGHSPSIMAWELFNEVQFVDRIRVGNDWATVGKWHDEMADYIRSIDTNKHLVTTSSELDQPIWRKADYTQGHGYPASVAGMLAGTPNTGPKPMFYGEIGPSGAGNERNANAVARREGLWTAFFSGHSGAGQYWTWDLMKDEDFAAYKFEIGIIKGLPPVRTFKKQAVVTQVELGADLDFRPGRGWAKSDLTSFNLPEDAIASKTGMLSSFIQGTGHREMQPNPLKFTFSSPKDGKMIFHVAEVSSGGGKLEVKVDGQNAFERVYAGGQKVSGDSATVDIPFPKGRHVITIENTGSDWVNIDRLTFSGIAPQATVEAVRSGNIVVLHIVSQKPGSTIGISNLGLPKGQVQSKMYDLDSQKEITGKVSRAGDVLKIAVPYKDQIVVIKR